MMFKIIRNQNVEIPSIDECRAAVIAFMENEVLRISVMEELKRERFYPYDWSTSKTSPQFLKAIMTDLIDKYGDDLLRYCFEEWRNENLISEFKEVSP